MSSQQAAAAVSNVTSMTKATPRKIKQHVFRALEARLVPFMRSSPGMGKSSIVKALAQELNLKLIDHRLSTSEPTDFSGLPHFKDGKATFAPFSGLFPTEDMEVPDGKEGWLLFLDEFNHAPKQVQSACYKLILDRQIGQYNLHPNVVVVCAGNLDTDRAMVQSISTAMQSRVIHLEMELSFQEWLEDVALTQNYDSRIIGFLSQYENHLMDFDPSKTTERTFCCPRTWEFMNRLIKGKPVVDEDIALFSGTITSDVAAVFIQFTKVYNQLVKFTDVLDHPDTCPVPEKNDIRWATISSLIEKVTEENFPTVVRYINRFELPPRVLFFRAALFRYPQLRRSDAFASSVQELARYLSE